MTLFPHNLVLDSQPRFGLAQSEVLNLNNLLLNVLADFHENCCKVSSLQPLSSEFKDNLSNPIPIMYLFCCRHANLQKHKFKYLLVFEGSAEIRFYCFLVAILSIRKFKQGQLYILGYKYFYFIIF